MTDNEPVFDKATLNYKPAEALLARYLAHKRRLDDLDTKTLLEDIRAYLGAQAENDDPVAHGLRERMDTLEVGW